MDSSRPASVVNKRGTDKTYRAFDGKVGALVQNGEAFVTSPNSNCVYKPLLGIREVYLRADFRFGEDDPLCYPQPFVPARCHYAVLRSRPYDPRDPAIKWWESPPSNAFVNDSSSIIDGMGTWSEDYVRPFKQDVEVVQQRVQLYRKSQERLQKRPNGMVTATSLQLDATVAYLTAISLPYSRARHLFSFFQRWYLELQAALDWVELIIPAIEQRTADYDAQMLSVVTANAVGAFCYSLKDCEQLFRAGVPFWYVRPIAQHPSTRIDQEVVPISPNQVVRERRKMEDHPNHVIFTGKGHDIAKAHAIEALGHTIVDFPDAFQTEKLPSVKPSTQDSTPSARPSRSQTTRGKQARKAPYNKSLKNPTMEREAHSERDKFTELRGAYSPNVADVWVNAISSIDRSLRSTDSKPVNGGYALPDPGLILWQAYNSGDETKSKLIRYVKIWLDLRTVLIFRNQIVPPCAASVAWSPRQWRLLLGTLDADHEADPESSMAKHRETIQQLLGQCLRASGLTMKEARNDAYRVMWRGREYTLGRLRDPDLIKEVAFELYELNFRLELQALNRKMLPLSSVPPPWVSEWVIQDDKVQACFPELGPQSCITTIHWGRTSAGLSAEKLRHRAHYFLQLRDVVKRWPGAEALQSLPSHTDMKAYSNEEFEQIEQTVAKFYCQTFFSVFGRPPIVPHCLTGLLPGVYVT